MLRKTARIGHSLNRNKITNPNLYPTIEKDFLTGMKLQVDKYSDKILAYASMQCYKGKDYVDIYLFDITREEGYVRFVVTVGEALSMEAEQLFLQYLQSDIYMCSEVLAKLEMDVVDKWNIRLNGCEDCRIFLLKLYFTTHQAGVLGSLFKRQLDIIALAVDEIEGINLIGENLEDVFGMPLQVLDKCNSKENLQFVLRQRDRVIVREIYKKFSNAIDSMDMLTYYQLKYLQECYEERLQYDKYIYEEISYIRSMREWNMLIVYLEKRMYLSEEFLTLLPVRSCIHDIEKYLDICMVLIDLELQDDVYKDRMLAKFRANSEKFRCGYGDWCVVGPESVYDLVNESVVQKTLLYTYIPYLLYSDDLSILFMRKRSSPDTPWITILLFDEYRIVQTVCRDSKQVSSQEYKLVEQFARMNNLVIELIA